MIEFIESPIFDNWFKKHLPKESLLICSPYVKEKALEKVLTLYNVESGTIETKVLIRGNSQEFTQKKSSDITILDKFLAMDGFDIDNVHRISNLHMKAYLVDNKDLLITSGNLTDSGMFVVSECENFEGGIATDDKNTVDRFLSYFQSIWNQSEAMSDFYEELVNEYTNYISNHYSDSENLANQVRRKKYVFSKKSQTEKKKKFEIAYDKLDVSIQTEEYDFSGLPPVGSIEYVIDTLSILNDNPQGLSYEELGEKLRNRLGLTSGADAKKRKQNNTKFGEEKGKYAGYFGLAVLTNGERKIIKLSTMGKRYLSMNEYERQNYLKDQIFSKSEICAVLKKIDEQTQFDIKDYLNHTYSSLSPTTLSRIQGALKGIIETLKQMCSEGELKDLLSKVQ